MRVNSTVCIGSICTQRKNPSMKTIDEIRHANLLLLIQEHGLIGDLNEKIGLARTDATLSQIRRFTPGTAAPNFFSRAFAPCY
jgi:hypothetical protein